MRATILTLATTMLLAPAASALAVDRVDRSPDRPLDVADLAAICDSIEHAPAEAKAWMLGYMAATLEGRPELACTPAGPEAILELCVVVPNRAYLREHPAMRARQAGAFIRERLAARFACPPRSAEQQAPRP